MKKKNIRWKKLGIIENEDIVYSFWFIGRDIAMNTINVFLKQGYHMQKRQLKTIVQEF